MEKNNSYSYNAKLKISKPILLANCISKCYLKHLGKMDGKNDIPIVTANPATQTNEFITPTIAREFSRIDSYMSMVSEKINRKNNALYRDTIRRIVKFEQAAFTYERLYERLEKKLKEDDIIIVSSPNIPQAEEDMLKCKRKSEWDLDDIGIRVRRFNEYQSKLKSMRQRLIDSRDNLEKQYREISVNIKQLKLLDTYIDTFFIYYSSKVIKRISWYWQGLILTHPNYLPNSFPIQPSILNIKNIHDNRRKDLEDKLLELERIHEKILNLSEL